MPEAISAQLKLPQGEGLLVEQIFPDSPAVKAGIERFDVLLRAGDKPLKTVADLVAAVDAGKGGKLALAIIRAGKSITVDATPIQRPADLRAGSSFDGLCRMGRHPQLAGTGTARRRRQATLAFPFLPARRDAPARRCHVPAVPR